MEDTPMVRVTKKTQVFADPNNPKVKPGWRLQLTEQIIGETVQTVCGDMDSPQFGRTFNIKVKNISQVLLKAEQENSTVALPLKDFKVKVREFVNDQGENKSALQLYPLGG